MNITSELMQKIRDAETPEDIIRIAKESGADITLENAKMIFGSKAPDKKKK